MAYIHFSRATFIQGRFLFTFFYVDLMRLLFEGGFYSGKYGAHISCISSIHTLKYLHYEVFAMSSKYFITKYINFCANNFQEIIIFQQNVGQFFMCDPLMSYKLDTRLTSY